MSNPLIHSAVLADADGEQFNVLGLLRKGTADIHQLIERRVPVFREGFNVKDYTRLVESFFGFWAPVEERLSNLKSLRDPDLALPGRLKCSLLRQDLLILGRDLAAVRQKEKLQLGERTGASFFNAYGGLTGARWMEFKGFISASVKSEHADNVVEAARETFLCFYEWLGTAS